MAQGAVVDLRDIVLSNSTFGPTEIKQLCQGIAEDFTQFTTLRDAVQELEGVEERSPATSTRLGVCLYLIGRIAQAEQVLLKGDGGALAQYYLGKVCFQQEQYERAIGYFDAAKKAGYDPEQCQLATAECMRYQGKFQDAMNLLDNMFGPVEQTAEYLYQRGATTAALGGNPNEVTTYFQRAVAADGRHAGALFGLAMENDRFGNDDEALRLYERAAGVFPTHIGTLVNLGIVYEDRNEYGKAQLCYKRILEVYPDHPRARLYMKDASASGNSYYDEESAKRTERLSQLLSIPVADFELSVRSRNCLQKMGVRTLGDLTRTTEQELLASKNFGETSLVEIRDMLSSKGLSLGQFSHERREPEPSVDLSTLSPDQAAVLDQPISNLNLSVRARKCMVRLGINTIGELIRKTGDDMLECKNFGVTSLNEVRQKLTLMNLKLRGD
jgi:DNA-directed RNA polymerase subunit alpha